LKRGEAHSHDSINQLANNDKLKDREYDTLQNAIDNQEKLSLLEPKPKHQKKDG
jgi:hypothetical protein